MDQFTPPTQVKVEERERTDLISSLTQEDTQRRTMSQLKYQPSLGETKIHLLIREQQRQFKSPAPRAWVGTGGNPDNEPSDDDESDNNDGKYESPLQSGGHPNIPYNVQSNNGQINTGGASN